MDYCPGGNISKLLDKCKKFTEAEAKIYLAEIILALEALHKNMIIYRDLKPENIVIDDNGHACLTDFGLAKQLNEDDLTRSFCGSPAYLPPEILLKAGHNRQVDWYHVGVILYEFLIGIPPYYADSRQELYDNIQRGPLKLPKNGISLEARDLIIKLLCRNPKKRLGYRRDGEEIREHPWFSDINWEDVFYKKLQPQRPSVKPYTEYK